MLDEVVLRLMVPLGSASSVDRIIDYKVLVSIKRQRGRLWEQGDAVRQVDTFEDAVSISHRRVLLAEEQNEHHPFPRATMPARWLGPLLIVIKTVTGPDNLRPAEGFPPGVPPHFHFELRLHDFCKTGPAACC